VNEHESRILTKLREKVEEAKGPSLAPVTRAEHFRLLITEIGNIAQGEWNRLEQTLKVKSELTRISGEEGEAYDPTPYYLCVIGVSVACSFGKNAAPCEMELRARVSLIEDAIEHAS
jgi:hypothetical protein